MINCTYTINGMEPMSYTQLLSYVDRLNQKGRLELDKLSDIVYSKYPKMDAQVDILNKIKGSYKPKAESNFTTSSIIDSEPNYNNSILNYLDSPECTLGGKPLVTPLNKEEFIKNESEKISEERNIPIEDAVKLVEATIENWKRVQEDGMFLHTTYASNEVLKSDSEFISKFYDSAPESLKDTRILLSLYNQLKNKYIYRKGLLEDSTTINGINLTAKIKGTAQEIMGHIDQMIIGKDGVLHLYLFKTTSTSPAEWQDVKKRKYKYQLAFLKAMLEAQNVDVRNIELSVIPVQLTYNKDYSKVTKVEVHYPKVYSDKFSDNGYAMDQYEKNVRYFIEIKPDIKPISNSFIKRIDEINKAIFPDLNIKHEGIAKSARSWIMDAPDSDPNGVEPLVIKEIGDIDHSYDVIINGKVYPIKTRKGKNTNPEILQIVQDNLTRLTDNLGYSTQRLKEAIQESYRKGFSTFTSKKGLINKANTLNRVLYKYLKPNRNKDGEITGYDWELMDNLIDANVLIFRNKDNEIDIINLSAFDLNQVASFSKSKTVLGSYLRKSEYIDLESNYGNIELIRTLSLINEIIPQLGNAKLGSIGVLSAVGSSPFVSYNIGDFSKKYYYKVIDTINTEVKGINIQNNFRNTQFVSEVDTLLKSYLAITKSLPEEDKVFYKEYGFDKVQDFENMDNYDKSEALRYILERIQKKFPRFSDFKYYEDTLRSNDKDGHIARLYDLVAKAYFSLTGQQIVRNTSYDNIEATFFSSNTIANENNQFIVNGLQTTYDTIAEEFDKIYENEIRKHFSQFYEKIGYGALQNMSLGNLAGQFNNLYNMEDMTFKNPYDMTNNLSQPERDLLKRVLYQIAQISSNKTFKLNFSDEAAIAAYIEKNPDYLWVPLERASKATARSGKDRVYARIKNAFRRLKNAEERFDEYVNGISKEERDLLGNSDEFWTFSLVNPFQLSMPINGVYYNEAAASRRNMIKKYGPEFFETNLENILIDYLVKSIQTEQLNKFMVVSKAFMLRMHLTGNMAGNSSVVDKEIRHIEKYLKINVFKGTIMSKQEQAVISAVMPAKQFATNVLIGGNVVGFVRDIFQGLEENFIRTVTKLNTDIDAKSVAKAYTYVARHATSNAMAINLLGKLCSRYRLSNTDVGRIGERYKTGRNGLLNYDNGLYGTLRTPDFINRMTLFVAKCMHDGVWEAYSIDDENNLKYDWTKDKRFSIYASGQTEHAEYKKQKALYFSKIKEYNEEHPDNKLEMTADLPSPYSQKEIKAIRDVGDNIYGAYDKSKKSMSEFHSLGILFTMFTTWMNGIVNNYCKKPQRNGISKLIEEQERDENGRLLWFDESGQYVYHDTGMPVYKFVPPIVMGIFPSIGVLASMCKEDGFAATYKYIKSNPMMKANMRKLLSDLLVSLLMLSLFKLALDPAYANYKKEAKDHPIVQNLATEILYKGSAKSYDTFKGLYNVLDFIGNNSATPIYSVPAQLMRNAYSFITDGKDLGTIFTTNTGIGRSFRDTYKIYKKSQ